MVVSLERATDSVKSHCHSDNARNLLRFVAVELHQIGAMIIADRRYAP
jgi:hypothetical protein